MLKKAIRLVRTDRDRRSIIDDNQRLTSRVDGSNDKPVLLVANGRREGLVVVVRVNAEMIAPLIATVAAESVLACATAVLAISGPVGGSGSDETSENEEGKRDCVSGHGEEM